MKQNEHKQPVQFDLHMHSEISPDGQLSLEQLVNMAKDKGLDVISLTDHDSTAGVEEITRIAREKGIEVIPGIECTTDFDGDNVHVLGYGVNLDDEYLNSLAALLAKKAADCFGQRIDKLEAKYPIHVDRQDVIRRANGKNPWFTLIDTILLDPAIQNHPDFAPYLPGGDRCDPAPVNFFWDKCQRGSDLYVDAGYPDFYETVKKIQEAGGVAIIAHPFKTFFKNEEKLEKAIQAGVIGLEAYSNYHNDEQTGWYLDYARKHNLLVTCGSDFHGEKKPSIEMGEYHMHEDGTKYLQALKEAMAAARQ